MTDKTDLPWYVDAHDNIFDKDGNRIAQVWGGDIIQDNARSALIVRAVNSHYDLIAALEDAREQILSFANARWSECEATEEELVGEIDATLAKAKAGS
jgi:hypothetical protein